VLASYVRHVGRFEGLAKIGVKVAVRLAEADRI